MVISNPILGNGLNLNVFQVGFENTPSGEIQRSNSVTHDISFPNAKLPTGVFFTFGLQLYTKF